MLRTHTCGQLRSGDTGNTVTLAGWVFRRRDHGGLIFIDLRDRYGLTQVVFDPEVNEAAHKVAEGVRPEWVIKLTGKVHPRQEGAENKDLSTGDIEVFADEVEVLSQSKTPPFELDTDKEVREDLRLEYRYLDLRRPEMQAKLALRHRMVRVIREFFDAQDFLEVETPILVKGTPEGSREYLVPSRLHPGSFYVLPQSPQQLKQLLMVGGVDRYFQIARCFRDEDQRGDRQPEFTQFEIEMSFVTQEDIITVIEDCFHALLAATAQHKNWQKYLVDGRFARLTWHEAMERYGSDKPDLRFDLSFVDVSDTVRDTEFVVFAGALKDGGCIKAMRVPGGAKLSRKDIDDLTEIAIKAGAKGLAYIVLEEGGELKSPILKFLSEAEQKALIEQTGAMPGDTIFFGAGQFLTVCESLGAVRSALGDKLGLKDASEFAFCWVLDFPLFEVKDDGTVQAAHHPFTRPLDEDRDKLETDPMNVRAQTYDVVLNGVELGGGSVRIHEPDLQKRVFELLGLSEGEIEMKFGHMMKAFSYGCPPHGGCAMGLDRVVMLWADQPNIREVMAFPKNQTAQDLMLGSPSPMPEKEVAEQNIRVIEVEE